MISRFIPRDTVELETPLAELFRSLNNSWPFAPFVSFAPGKHFTPTGDVFARNGDLVVRLDLPGMELKDIHIKYDEGILVVSGERKETKEVKEEGFYRKETSYGTFERRMVLPREIKESEIKAGYENGVLEIILPKVAPINGKSKAREIPIKSTVKV